MRRFHLTGLFLSSFLVWLIASCSPVAGYRFVKTTRVNNTDVRPIINPRGQASLYKANIKVFNKRYSGLLLLKQTDSLTAHITFVSEIGMKIFDYELKDNAFNLTYIFAPLNKPTILKLLENDMKLLVLHGLYNDSVLSYKKDDAAMFVVINKGTNDYYAITKLNNSVHRITRKGRLFKKERLSYTYNDSLTADLIQLKHNGLVRVKMAFKLLNTNSAKLQSDGY